MYLVIDNKNYKVEIEKKRSNRNTYVRITKDLTIKVTTNIFTKDREIERLLEEKYDAITKMFQKQIIKNDNNSDFHYLGKRYEIVYTNNKEIVFGQNKVFLEKGIDIDKYLKKQAKYIFSEHLENIYSKFSYKIPHPSLKIRKMTTRWGVCNIRLKTITLNLELIKRDIKYLDYVIVHELSHLIYPNHSSDFWKVVDENYPGYKQIRKEMKDF